ncbi:hypothetical protein C8246_17380 [Paracidovorax avenae]|nr:hypothetical protein C8246_17380 [Paracidovorax avenae]AVT07500.1 hypothetical protein C8248_17080 [Paracidovorax avenae]
MLFEIHPHMGFIQRSHTRPRIESRQCLAALFAPACRTHQHDQLRTGQGQALGDARRVILGIQPHR